MRLYLAPVLTRYEMALKHRLLGAKTYVLGVGKGRLHGGTLAHHTRALGGNAAQKHHEFQCLADHILCRFVLVVSLVIVFLFSSDLIQNLVDGKFGSCSQIDFRRLRKRRTHSVPGILQVILVGFNGSHWAKLLSLVLFQVKR